MADSRRPYPPDRIFQDTPLLPNPYVYSRQKELDDTAGSTDLVGRDAQPAFEEHASEGWGFKEIRAAIRYEELRRAHYQNQIDLSAHKRSAQRSQNPLTMSGSSNIASTILSTRRKSLSQAGKLGAILYVKHPEAPEYPLPTFQVEGPYPELDPTVSPEITLYLSKLLSKDIPYTYNVTQRIPCPPLSQLHVPQIGQVPHAYSDPRAFYPFQQDLDRWVKDPIRQATLRYYDRRITTLKTWLWKVFFKARVQLCQLFLNGRSHWSRTSPNPVLLGRTHSRKRSNSLVVTRENLKAEDEEACRQDIKRRHTLQVESQEMTEERPKLSTCQQTECQGAIVKVLDHRETSLYHREKSLYHGEQSLDHREKSLNQREKSLDHKERSLDHRESSLDYRERSLDHRGRSLDHKGKSLDHREKSLERELPSSHSISTTLSVLSLRGGGSSHTDVEKGSDGGCPEQDTKALQGTPQEAILFPDLPSSHHTLSEITDDVADLIIAAHDATSSRVRALLDAPDQPLHSTMGHKLSHLTSPLNEDSLQPVGGQSQTDVSLYRSRLPDSEDFVGCNDITGIPDASDLFVIGDDESNSPSHQSQSQPSNRTNLTHSDHSFILGSSSDANSQLQIFVPRQDISSLQQSTSPPSTMISKSEERQECPKCCATVDPNFRLPTSGTACSLFLRQLFWHVHLTHIVFVLKQRIEACRIETSRLVRRTFQLEATIFSCGLELRHRRYIRDGCVARLRNLRPAALSLFPCARRSKQPTRAVATDTKSSAKVHVKAKGAMPRDGLLSGRCSPVAELEKRGRNDIVDERQVDFDPTVNGVLTWLDYVPGSFNYPSLHSPWFMSTHRSSSSCLVLSQQASSLCGRPYAHSLP